MTDSQAGMDVLVDVAPGITVWRQGGRWFWKTDKAGLTLEDVKRELAFQAQRISMRSALLKEALDGLTG